MITITIDCNSDKMTITNDSTKTELEHDLEQPIKTIKMLQDIFNTLSNYGPSDFVGVSIVKIDEDTRCTVDEW